MDGRCVITQLGLALSAAREAWSPLLRAPQALPIVLLARQGAFFLSVLFAFTLLPDAAECSVNQ